MQKKAIGSVMYSDCQEELNIQYSCTKVYNLKTRLKLISHRSNCKCNENRQSHWLVLQQERMHKWNSRPSLILVISARLLLTTLCEHYIRVFPPLVII